MSLTAERDTYEGGGVAAPWWVFLITGIAWVLIAFMVLTVDADTPATIGLLAGFVLIVAGVNELVEVGLALSWRWLHATIGVLFVITGILALLSPLQTFGLLAVYVGWYLLIKGIADIVVSIVERARAADVGPPARRRASPSWPSASGRSATPDAPRGCSSCGSASSPSSAASPRSCSPSSSAVAAPRPAYA